MRLVGLVSVAAAAALLAGSAAADPIPIPPLPPPPVTVPPLPVPVPPPPPPPTAPVPVPAVPPAPTPAPVQTATSSLSQSAGSALGATSSGSVAASSPSSVTGSSYAAGQSGGGGSSASASPAAARGARVDHFHSSRPWIGTTGSKRRRTTTLTFVVQHPGRVIFTVNQVSPACVGVGHFNVAAHSGLNRVRFAGIVHGRRLGPGTYRISIRTAAGQVVRRVTLVVVDGAAPSRDELQALRASNACHGVAATGSPSTSSSSLTGATAPPLGPQKLPQPHTAAAGLAPTRGPNLHSGVLASTVEKTARAIAPILVALLVLSILLLGLASLPREAVPGPRVHDALARHRLELVTLGAAALVAVALAFFLT